MKQTIRCFGPARAAGLLATEPEAEGLRVSYSPTREQRNVVGDAGIWVLLAVTSDVISDVYSELLSEKVRTAVRRFKDRFPAATVEVEDDKEHFAS
jgi:hypothetical protein